MALPDESASVRDSPVRDSLVRWLRDCRAADLDEVGGKVAHLADLRAAGLPTPDGFAIPASAYTDAIAAVGLEQQLSDAEQRVAADPTEAAAVAAQCRLLVRGMTLPDALRDDVTAAYDELTLRRGEAYPLVAVRSSAIREDAADSSGAGQYTTVLGVAGADAVLDAVRECWVSMYSEHALLYRLRSRIRAIESPMAVGVIELVDARASGVAFSLDPVTGNPSRLVVESTFGWGESLVQGHVTPDRYEIAREDRRVLRRRIAAKKRMTTWSDGAIVEREMPPVLQDAPSLDDDAAVRIAATVVTIEEHLGCSVDVEWVCPKGENRDPVVVQARPETVHRLSADELRAPTRAAFDPITFAMSQTFPGVAGRA